MTSEIIGYMALFFGDCIMYCFHGIALSDAVIFENIISRDNYGVLILHMERALGDGHVAADACNVLLGEASSFIPSPNNNFDIWLSGECDKMRFLSSWRKANGDKFTGIVIK